MSIHLIEAMKHFVKLQGDVWESGSWPLDEARARELVGGEIYFHKTRQEPSFYGGTILGYRVSQEGEGVAKVVFKLQYNPACRNIRTDRTGWNKGMKITAPVEQPPAGN